MKVNELINELEKIKDKNLDVVGYDCDGEHWVMTRVITRNDRYYNEDGEMFHQDCVRIF